VHSPKLPTHHNRRTLDIRIPAALKSSRIGILEHNANSLSSPQGCRPLETGCVGNTAGLMDSARSFRVPQREERCLPSSLQVPFTANS